MKNKGVLYGALAYLMWGVFPLYFKAIHMVPALQIVAHRVVWSFLFLALVISLRKEWRPLRGAVSNPKRIGIYTVAALLLAVNWGVYVWAVNAGYVVETSLGYFINPLVSVGLGVLFLRERLRTFQWVSVGLAILGVVYLTVQYGKPPWIALALASSFGLYGLVKKVAPLGSLYGLTLETTILLLPSLAFLLFAERAGTGVFGHLPWTVTILLAFSGLVTALPLLLFASAARLIPLTMMGFLQYIAPICQFLLGVFVFKEPFSTVQLIGFCIIWLALILFSLESFLVYRQGSLNRASMQAEKI